MSSTTRHEIERCIRNLVNELVASAPDPNPFGLAGVDFGQDYLNGDAERQRLLDEDPDRPLGD
jgi:hypothetical protein